MSTPTFYRIRVDGELGAEWSDWLCGLSVEPQPDGTTLLSGRLADQAALHGLLARLRDLGLALLSLEAASDPAARWTIGGS